MTDNEYPPRDNEDPPRDLDQEVEHYAAIYPRRVREIRQHGGLPPMCSFGPPDDALVAALVASHSPAVLAIEADPSII